MAKNWVTAAQTTAASSRGLQKAPRFDRLKLRRPVRAGWGSGQHGTASTVHGCEGEWGGNVECLRFSFWGFGCYRKLQEMVRARSSEGHEPPKCWARCSCGQCSFFLLYFIHTPVGSLLPVHSRVKTGWLPGPVPSVRGRKLEKGRIEGETRGIERTALVGFPSQESLPNVHVLHNQLGKVLHMRPLRRLTSLFELQDHTS